LEGGIPVSANDWQGIGCDVCHQPVGDSYDTAISFWNQDLGYYEPVHNANELCAKCHEGRHGFQVLEEQAISPAHNNWECTRCHGAHGTPSSCTNCHNPNVGNGGFEHQRHPGVNCTACHDAGGLSIWQDREAGSKHLGEYAPIRFAHTLRSWTSHNIQPQVWCGRCHHLRENNAPPIAPKTTCQDCHIDGFVVFWCNYFPRDPSPFVTPTPTRK
jgi:hypothetical protein